VKYNRIFVHSEPFDEVQEKTYRMLDQGPCVQCGCLTYFLDYTRANKPARICSDACLYRYIEENFEPFEEPGDRSL